MPQYNLEAGSIQHRFYQSKQKIQLFGGGFANGKTTALAQKALKLCIDYPGCNGLLARETYPKLNDTLRKVFMLWCPPKWVKRKATQDDNTVYLTNGSVVNFRYIAQRGRSREDGATTSNLLSATYDWIGVDQVEDPGITYKDFLDLLGRLRGDTPYNPPEGHDDTMPTSGPRWLMLTSNPSYGWYYKQIVLPYIIWRDKGIRGEKLLVDAATGLPIIDLFEGSTYTNQKNLKADFISTLETTYKGQMKKRYLDGEWAAFEGLVHPSFDLTSHAIPKAAIETLLEETRESNVRVQVLEGYDFGIVSPSCYLLAFVDGFSRVFIVDGFYKSEYSYDEQPAAIFSLRAKWGLTPENSINADPAIFRRQVIAKRKNTGDTLAKLFKELKLDMRPATNDILPGIAKINSYLAGLPDIPHALTYQRPGPLLYVNEELEWFLDEMSSYYWKTNLQGTRIDEPIENNDHAMNALKYLLAFAPEPSQIIIPTKQLPPQWMFWHEKELDSSNEIG